MARRPLNAFARPLAAVAAGSLLVVSSAAPGLAAPALSAQASPTSDALTVSADRVEYNSATRVVRADGHVRATGRGAVITADHLEADLAAQEVAASGHVTLVQGAKSVSGSLLRYNLRTRVGHFEQVTGQVGIWHVSGQAIDLAPQQDVAVGASITPCDPDHPLYRVTASKIVIVPNESFIAYDAALWVAGVRVFSVPVYTATLGRRSGPAVGYNSPDGVYIEYLNSFRLGDWKDEYRVRLATTTGLTAENVISNRFGDHVWSVGLGRTQVKDQNGTLFNLDRYALDLEYDRQRIPGWPLDFQVEAHAGSYGEPATGVTTTRADAVVSFSSDTLKVSPSLNFSASGRFHFDAYGTGQQRTVVEGSTALSESLTPQAFASLSYSLVSVNGSTPFLFDAYSPSSAVSLYYFQSFGGFVQSASASITYGFIAQETTLGLTVSFSVNPNTVFNISAQYDLTTNQLSEVDYALNVRCDCATIGLVYQTFPRNPAGNTLQLAVQLPIFDSRNVNFSGSGAGF